MHARNSFISLTNQALAEVLFRIVRAQFLERIFLVRIFLSEFCDEMMSLIYKSLKSKPYSCAAMNTVASRYFSARWRSSVPRAGALSRQWRLPTATTPSVGVNCRSTAHFGSSSQHKKKPSIYDTAGFDKMSYWDWDILMPLVLKLSAVGAGVYMTYIGGKYISRRFVVNLDEKQELIGAIPPAMKAPDMSRKRGE